MQLMRQTSLLYLAKHLVPLLACILGSHRSTAYLDHQVDRLRSSHLVSKIRMLTRPNQQVKMLRAPQHHRSPQFPRLQCSLLFQRCHARFPPSRRKPKIRKTTRKVQTKAKLLLSAWALRSLDNLVFYRKSRSNKLWCLRNRRANLKQGRRKPRR